MKQSGLFKYFYNWPSKVGKWRNGEGVTIHGCDLFSELNDFSWMKMLLFQITGKRLDDSVVEVFNYVWSTGTSFPDPRIWNNRIASLAATTRSTPALAIGAASSIGEAKIFGGHPGIRTHDFLKRTMEKLKAGHTLPDVIAEELETNKSIYGFVRPYSNRDERLDPFIEKLKSLNFDQGEHYKLVFDVEAFLAKGKMKPTMNIAILLAAVCLDHGITGFEYWLIMSPCFIAGFLGCYTDALHNPPQTLFPISCEMIEYVGKQKKRSWIEE